MKQTRSFSLNIDPAWDAEQLRSALDTVIHNVREYNPTTLDFAITVTGFENAEPVEVED